MSSHARDFLLELLHKQEIVVGFTKADGTERIMTCTLVAEQLPPQPEVDPAKEVVAKKSDPNNVTVWDTANEGWRKIPLARMTSIQWKIAE